ncbi:MAG: hypothetical protein Fur0028_04340 [Bacteroidales bacterium]
MNIILPIALVTTALIVVNAVKTSNASDKLSYTPQKLNFKSFNGLNFNMVLYILISNPSYKSIVIDYYQFQVFDDGGNNLFNINCPSDTRIYIKERTDVSVAIPFSLSTFGTLTSIYQAVKEGGYKAVKIKGTLNANGFPVTIEQTIPINVSF